MENIENFESQDAVQETPAQPEPEVELITDTFADAAAPEPAAAAVNEEPQPATAPQRPVKKRKKGLRIVSIVALVLVACLITAAAMNRYWQGQFEETTAQLENLIKQNGGSQATVVVPDNEVSGDDLSPAQVYAENVDACVAITSQGLTTNIFGQVSRTASAGSGFIVSADGYVVTNFHVISGGHSVGVITTDGTEHQATLVGYDQTNDVAVLKIEGQEYPYVDLGSSDGLVVGERVAAIGNPLGELSSTLTVGYVSAKDRMINTDGTYLNMIQTDAAINSGNSGGPLFNMRGEVIGITTAKYSGTSNSGATIEGISFAIPIDDVKNLIEDFCEFGHVKSGYLGIMAQDVDADTAQQYGLPLGALVVEVTDGSCAQRAGMKAKDIIVKLGDYTIKSMSDLSRALSNYEGGEEVTVNVYRNGGEKELKVTLDAKPVTDTETQPQPTTEPEQPAQQPESIFPDWFFPFG